MRECTEVPFNASAAEPSAIALSEIAPSMLQALEDDGQFLKMTPSCIPRTGAGIAFTDGNTGRCADLGVGNAGTNWRQLSYFPALFTWMPRRGPTPEARKKSDNLQHELTTLQSHGSCSRLPTYTVAELPQIGFCAVIEHGMLQLARAASARSRLVLGRRSSVAWSSRWLCGRDRSLGCYFNISANCCPEEGSFEAALATRAGGGTNAAILAGRMAKLAAIGAAGGGMGGGKGGTAGGVRHGTGTATDGGKGGKADRATYGWSRALTFGGALAPYNAYGSLWVSGQLIHWLFSRMHPHIRHEIDRRRAAVLPRLPPPLVASRAALRSSREGSKERPLAYRELCIGMHVRRGDSCSLGSRFCPRNRTSAYFGAAAALRDRYMINRLIVATDDEEAAALCRAGVYGFDCRTLDMDRERFDARTSIERRVVRHTSGRLSGSAVALDALADVDMLADCEAHVLVLRSAVSRLALGLSVARKGRYSPLISLQWPWGGLPGPSPIAVTSNAAVAAAAANADASRRRIVV